MTEEEILLLSNLQRISKTIIEYFTNEAIQPISNINDINLKNNKTIVIIDPFLINNEFVTISPIWKQYLKEKPFDFPLIVMGFRYYSETNYIDLLRLPNKLETVIKKAKPVREEWYIPIDGLDLRVRFASYFKGHGEESIFSILNKLCQSFNVAYLKIEDKDIEMDKIMSNLIYPYAIPEWRKFVKSWNKFLKLYKSYSDYLPFNKVMITINKLIKKHTERGEEIVRNASDVEILYHELMTVKDSLETIDKAIRPEVYDEL